MELGNQASSVRADTHVVAEDKVKEQTFLMLWIESFRFQAMYM